MVVRGNKPALVDSPRRRSHVDVAVGLRIVDVSVETLADLVVIDSEASVLFFHGHKLNFCFANIFSSFCLLNFLFFHPYHR